MARYASGRKSKAISDITGFKVNYTSLKTTYDHLRVEPEEFDIKHPQLTPAKNVVDATALFQPRPDNAQENVKLFLEFNSDIFASKIEKSQKGIGVKGKVNIGLLPRSSFNFGADSGVAVATGAISNNYLINTQIAETGTSGTTAVGLTTHIVNKFIITKVGNNPSNHPYYNVGSANKFAIGGSTATADVTLDLVEGNIYRFDQSDSSNIGHPLRFSLTANGTWASGSEYTTGVTLVGTPGYAGAYTQIQVAIGVATLYYYCTQHSNMGWTANTPTNVSVVVTASVVATGEAGTGAIGTATLVGNPVAVGVNATGNIGTESINVGGWGQEGWNVSTWGDG